VLEYWSVGVMGNFQGINEKEEYENVFIRLMIHYSITPSLHVIGIIPIRI